MSSVFGQNGLEGTSVFDYRDIGERVNSNFEGKLGNYYTKNDSDSRYPRKDAIYTKTEVDNRLSDTDKQLSNKVNSEDVYDTLTTDNLLSNKVNSEDVYDTLTIDNLLSNKANTIDVYNKSETDNLLTNKVNSEDVYDTLTTDNLLSNKVDKSNVYTKDETDNLLSNTAKVENPIPNKFFDFSDERYILTPTLSNPDSFTIEFWVLFQDDADKKAPIWNHTVNSSVNDFLTIREDVSPMFITTQVRGISIKYTYSNSLEGEWNHIAITQTPDKMELYLNGNSAKINSDMSGRVDWTSEKAGLGSNINSDTSIFTSRFIYNWKVYNYVKSETEIQQTLLTNTSTLDTRLIQYIPLDEEANNPKEVISNTSLVIYDANDQEYTAKWSEASNKTNLINAFNSSTHFYDKETTDNLLNDKANKDEIYTRPELYTKNEIDILLNNGSEINNNNTFNSVFITNSTLNKYPSGVATSNNWTVSGKDYGNGTYVVSSSSSLQDDVYLAFNGQPYSDYGWHTVNDDTHKYDSATGAYLGTSTFQGDSGEWLKIQMPEPFMLGEYRFYPRTDYATSRMPSHFKLYGSTDNTNWDLLDEQTNIINREGEPSVFQISNSTSYDYYTIVVLVNGNETTTSVRNTINLSEIEFYEGQVVSKIDDNGDVFANDVKANTLDINNELNENFLRLENTGNSSYITYGDLSNDTTVGHKFNVRDFDQNSGLSKDCAFFSNEKNYLFRPTEIWGNLSMDGNSIENVANIYTKSEVDAITGGDITYHIDKGTPQTFTIIYDDNAPSLGQGLPSTTVSNVQAGTYQLEGSLIIKVSEFYQIGSLEEIDVDFQYRVGSNNFTAPYGTLRIAENGTYLTLPVHIRLTFSSTSDFIWSVGVSFNGSEDIDILWTYAFTLTKV